MAVKHPCSEELSPTDLPQQLPVVIALIPQQGVLNLAFYVDARGRGPLRREVSIVGFEHLGGDRGVGGVEGELGPKLDEHEWAIGLGQFGHYLVGCFGECHVYFANYGPAEGAWGEVLV